MTSKALIAVVLATLSTSVAVTSASAASFPAECSNLQSTIAAVAAEANHGEGDVIVLSGLCDASNLGSSGGVTLPAASSFSIEGKSGTTSGFDGAGVGGPLLGTAGSEETGAMTLGNLTFQHANLTSTSALSIRATRLTLNNDRFIENEEHGESAHAAFVYVGQSQVDCPPATGPAAITVTDSTFSNNKLDLGSSQGGGAGAWIQDTCESSRNVLEGNTVEDNTLEAAGTAEGATVTGAGLQFVGGPTWSAPVSQSANLFDSNTIVAPIPDLGNYGGGGEWLEDANLQSTGDRYSRNTIAGTSSSSYERWSWGAGLGISNLSFACSKPTFPESTLEDAVFTGNTIGPGMEADLGGGGAWVGCTHLRVLDSTVTLNSAPYGAGIEGEPGDQLELVNSIVADDSGGNEIAGFEGEAGASLIASFSDVCAVAGSSAPLPGSGNICANPLLADDGNPSSFDVHETESSPTIDAGSNALIPGELVSDFYGVQRVLPGRFETSACPSSTSVLPILDPPIVDMGASEFGPLAQSTTAVLCKVTTNPQTPATQTPVSTQARAPMGPTTSTFSPPSLTQQANGVLTLKFKGLVTGKVIVRGTFDVARNLVTIVKGKHRRRRTVVKLTYCQSTRTVSSPGSITLKLNPTKQARAMLTHGKHLRVSLSITFIAAGATPSTREKSVVILHPTSHG